MMHCKRARVEHSNASSQQQLDECVVEVSKLLPSVTAREVMLFFQERGWKPLRVEFETPTQNGGRHCALLTYSSRQTAMEAIKVMHGRALRAQPIALSLRQALDSEESELGDGDMMTNRSSSSCSKSNNNNARTDTDENSNNNNTSSSSSCKGSGKKEAEEEEFARNSHHQCSSTSGLEHHQHQQHRHHHCTAKSTAATSTPTTIPDHFQPPKQLFANRVPSGPPGIGPGSNVPLIAGFPSAIGEERECMLFEADTEDTPASTTATVATNEFGPTVVDEDGNVIHKNVHSMMMMMGNNNNNNINNNRAKQCVVDVPAVLSLRGARNRNEDAACQVRIVDKSGHLWVVAALADGHGASDERADALVTGFCREAQKFLEACDKIDVLATTDKVLEWFLTTVAGCEGTSGGSTLVAQVCDFYRGVVHVLSLGDSQAMLVDPVSGDILSSVWLAHKDYGFPNVMQPIDPSIPLPCITTPHDGMNLRELRRYEAAFPRHRVESRIRPGTTPAERRVIVAVDGSVIPIEPLRSIEPRDAQIMSVGGECLDLGSLQRVPEIVTWKMPRQSFCVMLVCDGPFSKNAFPSAQHLSRFLAQPRQYCNEIVKEIAEMRISSWLAACGVDMASLASFGELLTSIQKHIPRAIDRTWLSAFIPSFHRLSMRVNSGDDLPSLNGDAWEAMLLAADFAVSMLSDDNITFTLTRVTVQPDEGGAAGAAAAAACGGRSSSQCDRTCSNNNNNSTNNNNTSSNTSMNESSVEDFDDLGDNSNRADDFQPITSTTTTGKRSLESDEQDEKMSE